MLSGLTPNSSPMTWEVSEGSAAACINGIANRRISRKTLFFMG